MGRLGRVVTVIALASGQAALARQQPSSPPPVAGSRQPGTYPLSPDSLPQAGVPKGRLEGPFEFHSKIIAGTVRRYWVYVPAQYNPKKPANVLVFQDGQRATNPDGPLRVPQVHGESDRARGEIPVTIGIFITPGNLQRELSRRSRHGESRITAREEYDALNDTLRALPDRGDAARRSGKTYNLTQRSGEARDRRHVERRDLRVHRRLAAARLVPQRHQHDRQLHLDRLRARRGRQADDARRRSLSRR